MLSAPHLRVDLAVEERKWASLNDSALVRDARLWWRDFSRLATWGLAGPSRVVWVGSAKNVIAPI